MSKAGVAEESGRGAWLVAIAEALSPPWTRPSERRLREHASRKPQ